MLNTRTGAILDLRASVRDSGLRSGDRRVPPHRAAPGATSGRLPRAPFEVWVVGGPGAGARRPLGQATLSVGRSSSCDLTVPDRSISRHHLTLHAGSDGVAVEDMGSSNGTSVEGIGLTPARPRPLASGEQIALGRTLLSVHRVRRPARHDIRVVDARLAFNRPPRVQPAHEGGRLRLGRAPDEPSPRRIPWIVALAPLVLGIGFAVITKQLAMLAFAALTPVMVLGSYVSDRRGSGHDHARAVQRYRHELATLEHQLATRQLEEINARRRRAPDPATLAARATLHEPELWERRPRDEDFLELRVGVADQASLTTREAPTIVVALHDYGEFVSAYERVSMGAHVDAVPALVADERAVGVHFVLTAERRSAVPPSLLNTVARRLVLRMANREEYAALGLNERVAAAATATPGRGLTTEGLELQVAVEGEHHEGEAQLKALAVVGRRLREADAAVAPGIASLPTVLEAASLPRPARAQPLRPVIGISDEPAGRYDTFRPLTLDLESDHLLVAGPYRSGRSTVLATIAAQMFAAGASDLHLVSPRTRTDLHELGVWSSTARGTDACAARANELADIVRARDPAIRHVPMVVMVDDAGELAQSPAEAAPEVIVRRGREVDLRVVVAVETQTARTMWESWFKEIRKEGQGLLLAPDADQDGALLGVQLPRHRSMAMPPGRGYSVDRGQVCLVQVARCTPVYDPAA